MAHSWADGPHWAFIIPAEPTLACCIAGEAKRTATRFLKLESARLALGIMCTVAPVQFVIGQFRADNSGSKLGCWEGMPDQLCDLLAMGKLDLALMLVRSVFRHLFMLGNSTRSGSSLSAPWSIGLPWRMKFAWPTSTVSSTSRDQL